MAKKKGHPDKPVRVQFGKGATSHNILDGIHKAQDNWAKSHPKIANKLYPEVYDEKGNRIKTPK
jgi:hypothetical protein